MSFSIIKRAIKNNWQILFGVLCIVLAIIFFAKSDDEIKQVSKAIKSARFGWFYLGIGLSILYVIIQGCLYLFSFKTICTSPSYLSMVLLYLKRLLLGILLPAGGVASLAFTTKEVEGEASKPQIYFASAIYIFTSCTSILLFSIPAILLTELEGKKSAINPLYLIPIAIIIVGIILLLNSYVKKKWAYQYIIKHYPELGEAIEEVDIKNFSLKLLIYTFIISIVLDFTGVSFAYTAMKSITGEASIGHAFITYAIVFIIQLISPFLNGLGAIEAALTLLFKQEGYTPGQALLTALMYRFFSFWLPLIYSIFSYIFKRDSLILKVFPAFFSLALGIINIVTILFPSILNEKELLQKLISNELISITSFVQFAVGIILIVNSVYLYKKYFYAWLIVVVACVLSIAAHLIVGDGYQYAIASFLILLVLMYTRKDYQMKDVFDVKQSITTFALMIISVFIYGFIGFYFLGEEHFVQYISLNDALKFSLNSILLTRNLPLNISTGLGEFFYITLKVGSVLCFAYLIIQLITPLFQLKSRS